MDSIHDLGGKQGYGAICPSDDPVGFAERWHAAVFAMVMSSGGRAYGSVDQFRHAVERIDPAAYLTYGYYGRWLGGLETLLLESGIVTREELNCRVAALDDDPPPSAARPNPHPERFADSFRGLDARRAPGSSPRFAPGQSVRTRSTPSSGHTRLPAYARGKRGTVVTLRDGWVLPDLSAHGDIDHGEHVYTIAFDGAELWGDAGERGLSVRLDLFESYLSEDTN